MFGLPSQSREQWMATLRNVLDLKPDHISCYGLKVEQGTRLWEYKDCANLPDDDAQADMYFYAWRPWNPSATSSMRSPTLPSPAWSAATI